MKRKHFKILSVLILFSIFLVACGNKNLNVDQNKDVSTETQVEQIDENDTNDETVDTVPLKILALKGPTGMGLAKLIEDSDNGITKGTYTLEILNSPEDIVAKTLKNEGDIVFMPSNMASIIWNKSEGAYQNIAINTLGVLYIVENGESVNTIDDLKGKTVFASGKGATPEYALNFILNQNNIDVDNDINIEWKTEHSEVLAAISSTPDSIAMMPQPFVTIATSKVPSLNIRLNLTEEWDKVENDSALITGVTVANKEFIANNKASIDLFLEEYEKSTEFTNENIDDAAKLIVKHGIFDNPEVIKTAIPYCNIKFIEGDEMAKKLSNYLNILFQEDPKSVGGTLPDENFYYKK